MYTQRFYVNLFAFAYRLFHEDFFPINGAHITLHVGLYTCKGNHEVKVQLKEYILHGRSLSK